MTTLRKNYFNKEENPTINTGQPGHPFPGHVKPTVLPALWRQTEELK